MLTSTKFGIPYIQSGQATPETTHNAALYMFEILGRGVKDRLNVPPGAPVDGDTYLITAVATGAWAGKENHLTIWAGNGWYFLPGFDSAGSLIAIGAAHEGIQVYVMDEDALYRWSGAAWAVAAIGTVAASAVTNTPAGGIAATNVQAAINELDTEKVAKAGDTMTGALVVDLSSGALPTLPGSLAAAYRAAGINSTTYFSIFGDSFQAPHTIGGRRSEGTRASPTATANGADILSINGYGRGATGYVAGAKVQISLVANEVWTDTANGTRVIIEATPNGSTTRAEVARFVGGAGLLMAGASGAAAAGAINAINYFDDGVNISSIYASLALANTYPQQQSFTLAGGQTVATSAILAVSTDPGTSGPTISIFHDSASPAANDTSRLIFFGRNSAAVETRYGQISCAITDPVSGSEDSRLSFLTIIAGAAGSRVAIGAGLFAANLTDQGVDSCNFATYYANGGLIANANGVIICRTYTVATLPVGVAGGRSHVSDATLALAPGLGTVPVGGGPNNIPVVWNAGGGAWNIG